MKTKTKGVFASIAVWVPAVCINKYTSIENCIIFSVFPNKQYSNEVLIDWICLNRKEA
ncbi:hypothetical protein ACR6HW_06215 [Fusibacter sp. JL298sf-3]